MAFVDIWNHYLWRADSQTNNEEIVSMPWSQHGFKWQSDIRPWIWRNFTLDFSHRVHFKSTMTSHTPRSQTTIHLSPVLPEVCWTKAYCYCDKVVFSCSGTFQSVGIRILPKYKWPYMYVWSFVCVIFTMTFAILLVNSMFNQCHWRSLITTMAFFSIDGTI